MIQILLVAVAVLVTSISYRLFGNEGRFLLIAFFIGLAATIISRQFVPRLLALRNPERTLFTLLPLYKPFYGLLSLLAVPWHRSFDRPRRAAEHPTETGVEESEDDDDDGSDLQALIDVGEEEGILEEDEGELIQSIIEFGETRAGEVMTPRTDIVALPSTATVREARDLIIESKYSRLPVYRGQIDNVEGLIYVRDLLSCWPEGREGDTIETLLRPAYFVPDSKAVDELLKEMQKAHVNCDGDRRYGGVAGLLRSKTSSKRSSARSRTRTSVRMRSSRSSNRTGGTTTCSARPRWGRSSDCSTLRLRTTILRPSPGWSSTSRGASPCPASGSPSAASTLKFSKPTSAASVACACAARRRTAMGTKIKLTSEGVG